MAAGLMEHFAATVAEGRRFLDPPTLKFGLVPKGPKEPATKQDEEGDNASEVPPVG